METDVVFGINLIIAFISYVSHAIKLLMSEKHAEYCLRNPCMLHYAYSLYKSPILKFIKSWKSKSTLLTLEVHVLGFLSFDPKSTNFLHYKNKRPLNFNDLSLKTNYSKNGAEKMTRSLYI